MGSTQHTEKVREYLFDLVTDSKGENYAVSTVRLPGGEGMGRAYQTSTFDADRHGRPDWQNSISTDYSADWESAKETHAAHIKWIAA